MIYTSLFLIHFLRFCRGLERDKGWNYINIHCRDNDNAPAEWWYIYKPAGENAPYDDSGRNFTYASSEINGRWQLSDRTISTNNMLHYSLAPMYRRTYVDRVAVLAYEAEVRSNPGSNAYGLLLADEVGGIFITHTVPNLVDITYDRPRFPEAELVNGHLISCIRMDVFTLNSLAIHVKNSGAKITAVRVPDTMKRIVPSWLVLNSGRKALRFKPPDGLLEFEGVMSKLRGMILVRKPSEHICLYRAFAKRANVILDIYSPRPGGWKKTSSCAHNYGVRNIESISLKWSQDVSSRNVMYIDSSTDMMRFAVSTAARWQTRSAGDPQYWACTSSLDLDDSDGKGGILFCVHDYHIWQAFDNFKVKEPVCN